MVTLHLLLLRFETGKNLSHFLEITVIPLVRLVMSATKHTQKKRERKRVSFYPFKVTQQNKISTLQSM